MGQRPLTCTCSTAGLASAFIAPPGRGGEPRARPMTPPIGRSQSVAPAGVAVCALEERVLPAGLAAGYGRVTRASCVLYCRRHESGDCGTIGPARAPCLSGTFRAPCQSNRPPEPCAGTGGVRAAPVRTRLWGVCAGRWRQPRARFELAMPALCDSRDARRSMPTEHTGGGVLVGGTAGNPQPSALAAAGNEETPHLAGLRNAKGPPKRAFSGQLCHRA